jgi:hypothetical protein
MPDDNDIIRQDKPRFPNLDFTLPTTAVHIHSGLLLGSRLAINRSGTPQIGHPQGGIAPPCKRYKYEEQIHASESPYYPQSLRPDPAPPAMRPPLFKHRGAFAEPFLVL